MDRKSSTSVNGVRRSVVFLEDPDTPDRPLIDAIDAEDEVENSEHKRRHNPQVAAERLLNGEDLNDDYGGSGGGASDSDSDDDFDIDTHVVTREDDDWRKRRKYYQIAIVFIIIVVIGSVLFVFFPRTVFLKSPDLIVDNAVVAIDDDNNFSLTVEFVGEVLVQNPNYVTLEFSGVVLEGTLRCVEGPTDEDACLQNPDGLALTGRAVSAREGAASVAVRGQSDSTVSVNFTANLVGDESISALYRATCAEASQFRLLFSGHGEIDFLMMSDVDVPIENLPENVLACADQASSSARGSQSRNGATPNNNERRSEL